MLKWFDNSHRRKPGHRETRCVETFAFDQECSATRIQRGQVTATQQTPVDPPSRRVSLCSRLHSFLQEPTPGLSQPSFLCIHQSRWPHPHTLPIALSYAPANALFVPRTLHAPC